MKKISTSENLMILEENSEKKNENSTIISENSIDSYLKRIIFSINKIPKKKRNMGIVDFKIVNELFSQEITEEYLKKKKNRDHFDDNSKNGLYIEKNFIKVNSLKINNLNEKCEGDQIIQIENSNENSHIKNMLEINKSPKSDKNVKNSSSKNYLNKISDCQKLFGHNNIQNKIFINEVGSFNYIFDDDIINDLDTNNLNDKCYLKNFIFDDDQNCGRIKILRKFLQDNKKKFPKMNYLNTDSVVTFRIIENLNKLKKNEKSEISMYDNDYDFNFEEKFPSEYFDEEKEIKTYECVFNNCSMIFNKIQDWNCHYDFHISK